MGRYKFEQNSQLAQIEQSEYVKRASEGLKERTRGAYLTYLSRFVNDFLHQTVTIEQLVAEAKEDVTKTQDHIDHFYSWLVKECKMKESSAFIASYGYIRGFFANLDVQFQRKWSKSHTKIEHTKQAIQQDNIVDFFILDEASRSVRFNRELMQKFLSNLGLRDQAITLALLSSAQDSGDLFSLNIGDIRKQENGRIYWEGQRAKTDVLFKTFFSKEATRLIRRYIELERQGAEDSEPLFVFTSRREGEKGSKGKRLTPNYLSEIYRVAAKKMGITWKKHDQSPLRPKRMRHLFRTACDTAGIDELYVNAFMGHKNHMGQSYSELKKPTLELQYLRVEPFLTVYGEAEASTEVKEDVRKLENRVGELNRIVEQQKESLENLQTMLDTRVEEIARKSVKRILEDMEKVAVEPLREEGFTWKRLKGSRKGKEKSRVH